jgi:hydroxycarboxylate dehydrogenase B
MSGQSVEHVDADALQAMVSAIVKGSGAPDDVAEEVALHLVRADLSGHTSHGVLRLSQYMREVDSGLIDPAAKPVVLSTLSGAILLDARSGFGHFAAATAVVAAAKAARASGIAAVAIRNCTHIGRIGEYSERLAGQGLIALIMLGAVGPGVGAMAPFGSKTGKPLLNSNPWSVGFPSSSGEVIFDGSMSNIAEGKVHAAKSKGMALPDGSIPTASGTPSTNPDDFYAGGTLTPLGGGVAGHKGYGLALSAALLGGLAHADGSSAALRGLAVLRSDDPSPDSLGGVTIMALDPAAFGGTVPYSEAVGRVSQALRAEGALVPGDMERGHRDGAERRSVPIPAATWTELLRLQRRVAHG